MATLLGLPGRFGQLMVEPRAALQRIEAEGGALRDAVWLVVLGAITLRFPQLVEAVLGVAHGTRGALPRVLAVFSNEARDGLLVVIPASLLITIFAGRRRDSTLDLELGAASFLPFFAVRAVARVIAGGGHMPEGALPPAVSYTPALVWAGLILLLGIATARRRPLRDAAGAAPATDQRAPVAAPRPAGAAVRAGALGIVLLGVGLASNVVWASRHFDVLRPIEHGELAPDFELPRADGRTGTLSLGSLRGKVVLLDFWATWCPPCLQMIPVLHDVHRQLAERGVEIVGVNSDGGQMTLGEVQEFLRGHPSPYPIVLDDGRANAAYKVRALPQMVVIGRDGAVRQVFIGYTSRSDLIATLTRALDDGPAP